jgi:hypothetical protein
MELLKRTLLCTHCNCSITWYIYNKTKEKYVWKCMIKKLPKYKTNSIRSGSMFEDCRADLNLIIFAMYLWIVGTRKKLAYQLTWLSNPPIIMVCSFLTVMCERYFENDQVWKMLYARLMKVYSHKNQSITRYSIGNWVMEMYTVCLLWYTNYMVPEPEVLSQHPWEPAHGPYTESGESTP